MTGRCGCCWQVFDLRNQPEIDRDGHAELDFAVYKHRPGFGARVNASLSARDGTDPVPVRPNGKPWGTLELGYVVLYLFILDHGTAEFADVLRSVLHCPDGQSVLVHCTSGKDRTGVLAALIQALAGVDTLLIAEDYHLTEALQPPTLAYMRKAAPPGVKAFANLTDEEMVAVAKSPFEVMVVLMDVLRRQWGSAEGYCESMLGLTGDEIARLKARLVEPRSRV